MTGRSNIDAKHFYTKVFKASGSYDQNVMFTIVNNI